MKKVIFTIAIILGLAFGATAQSDGFFSNWENIDDTRLGNDDTPLLPTAHNTDDNYDAAPLGGGLLILTALGVGYAFKRRVESEELRVK